MDPTSTAPVNSKKTIVSVLCVIVLLVFGGWYWFTHRSMQSAQSLTSVSSNNKNFAVEGKLIPPADAVIASPQTYKIQGSDGPATISVVSYTTKVPMPNMVGMYKTLLPHTGYSLTQDIIIRTGQERLMATKQAQTLSITVSAVGSGSKVELVLRELQ